MIPDDCVIVIRQNTTDIDQIEKEVGTVFTADSGFPGIYSRDALSHTTDYENPHEVKLTELVLPEGNEGKWLTLGEDGVVITDEQPIFREDVHAPSNWDTCVKADALAPQAHLDGVISEPFCIAGDKMRVKGNDRLNKRMYFGTDVAGTVGITFSPGMRLNPTVPGEKVIP